MIHFLIGLACMIAAVLHLLWCATTRRKTLPVHVEQAAKLFGMIRIKLAKNNQLYFVVVAANNRILACSETYKRKAGLLNGIEALILAVEQNNPANFKLMKAENGKPYFIITANNHRVLVHSETYEENRKAIHGLEVCKQAVLNAEIIDDTGMFSNPKKITE